MSVIHFINKDTILCLTKGKNIKSTEVKENVTCKRCMKKLNVSVIGSKSVTKPKRQSKTTVEEVGRFVMLTNKDFMFRFDMEPSKHFMFCTSTGTCFTSAALLGSQIKKNMKNKDRKKMIDIFNELKDNEGNVSGRDVLNYFK